MGLIRGCLMLLGLVMLLFITSCVLGVTGFRRVANPTHFSRTVEETPDKTRRMLGDFLETAEADVAPIPGVADPRATVADYSDGSIHLQLDAAGKRLMEVVVKVTPAENGARVEVFSDAAALGEAVRPRLSAAALHRAIRSDLSGALGAIDAHRVLPGGFLVSRLVEAARERRTAARYGA